MSPSNQDDRDGGIDVIERTNTRPITKDKPKTEPPKMFKVLLHNDHITPFEFVLHVLQKVFKMSEGQAVQVMMTAHTTGLCLCGVFKFEIAEQYVATATEMGKAEGHALRFTYEKED